MKLARTIGFVFAVFHAEAPLLALHVDIVAGDNASYTNLPEIRWQAIAVSLGYSATIHDATFLDDPGNLSGTDILITSTAVDMDLLAAQRVNTIVQYLQQGGRAYLQAEHSPANPGSILFASVMTQLGVDFLWTGTVGFGFDWISPMQVVGSIATNDMVLPQYADKFWWGCNAVCEDDLEVFLRWQGAGFGFIHCLPGSNGGRIITVTDSDYLENYYDATVGHLMRNILVNLSDPDYVCANGNDPGIGDTLSYCRWDDPFELFGLLQGTPSPAGSWTGPAGAHDGSFDPSSDPPGAYVYTVGDCTQSSTTITLVERITDAGTSSALAVCEGGGLYDLFSALGGTPDSTGTWTDPDGLAHDGWFDAAQDPPGAYTYQVAFAGCEAASATVSVGVIPAPFAGSDGTALACGQPGPLDLFTQLAGAQPGGAWQTPAGEVHDGLFDPGIDPTGVYAYVIGHSQCGSDTAHVEVLPFEPPPITIDHGPLDGCAPLAVAFTSSYLGPGAYHWDFGNGSSSMEAVPPAVLFTNSTTVPASLTIDHGNGCLSVASAAAHVTLRRTVAAFTTSTSHVTPLDRTVQYINASTGADGHAWDFGQAGTSEETHPMVTYPLPLPARLMACLVTTIGGECPDTACLALPVLDEPGLWVPNCFTPNGDGINDGFGATVHAKQPATFTLTVYDRWGAPIFSATDPGAQWEGGGPGGEPIPNGVYPWLIMATYDRSPPLRLTGHVTLAR